MKDIRNYLRQKGTNLILGYFGRGKGGTWQGVGGDDLDTLVRHAALGALIERECTSFALPGLSYRKVTGEAGSLDVRSKIGWWEVVYAETGAVEPYDTLAEAIAATTQVGG